MTAGTVMAHVGPGVEALAIDVGGTIVKSSFVTTEGGVRAAARQPTARGDDPALAVVVQIADLFQQAIRTNLHRNLSTLAIAVPGIVDEDAGVGVYSENLGWRDAPFRSMLEARVDAHVVLLHDVRAAGAAETRLGAGAGAQNVVTVPIGTGISAALWLDGRPVRGHGCAGEIGHIRVTAEDVKCVCGAFGCLEAVSSAAAIERRYLHLRGAESIAGAQDVVRLAGLGDPVAGLVWEEALQGLAVGLAAVAGVVAPEVIVLGGGLSLAGEDLIRPLSAHLAGRLRMVPVPKLVRAHFGADSGTVGAALSTRPPVEPFAAWPSEGTPS